MSAGSGHTGAQAAFHLAYAPQGAGLLWAVTWFVEQRDVFGWWIGLRDFSYPAAFFEVERWYSGGPTAFLATAGADLYGGWRYDYLRRPEPMDKAAPIEDGVCHRLARLQESFFREWLWQREEDETRDEIRDKSRGEVRNKPRRSEPANELEERYYREAELALQRVNPRRQALGRFDRTGAVWTCQSPGLDQDLLAWIRARWPLEYGRPD